MYIFLAGLEPASKNNTFRMAPPILAVVGASGQQGSSILSYLSQHNPGGYALRAIVRNPAKYSPPSPSIEVVEGDYTSLNTLLPALEGASFVFALTNPDMTFHGLEEQWGKNIGDAVLAAPSVQLLIFSGSADAPKLSEGTLRCYNFAGKAAAQEYIAGLGIPGLVMVWPGMFMQNFLTYQKPTTETQTETAGDGHDPVTLFECPLREDVLVPFVDIEKDLGRLVAAILDNPGKYVGKTVKLVGEWMTYPSLARRWSSVTGKESRFRKLGYGEFGDKFGGPVEDVREMIVDMYKFVNRFGYYGGETEDSEDLSAETTPWEDFVRRNWAIPSPGKSTIPQFTETPATRALAAYYHCFSPSNGGPIDELWALFDDSAVVEFPYAPPDRPSVLSGLSAIKEYYSGWPSVFEFHRWFGASIHPAITSDADALAIGEGRKAFGEIQCEGVIKTTGKRYRQKYVGVCEVGMDGKIVKYREYWNPMAVDAIGDWNVERV